MVNLTSIHAVCKRALQGRDLEPCRLIVIGLQTGKTTNWRYTVEKSGGEGVEGRSGGDGASVCMAISCKIYISRSYLCIIKYTNLYRKRSGTTSESPGPIRSDIGWVYFPGIQS